MLELDIDLIIAYNLTLEEYVLLDLLRCRYFGKIRKYFNNEEQLYALLDRLVLLNHISLIELGNRKILGDYKVKFFPRFTPETEDLMVKELLETYPHKVIRPDGKLDYLRAGTKTISEQYKKILKANKSKHEHILACLKYQIEEMTKAGRLPYLRKLTNWLEKEEWKEWEEQMLDSAPTDVLGNDINKVNNIYGNLL